MHSFIRTSASPINLCIHPHTGTWTSTETGMCEGWYVRIAPNGTMTYECAEIEMHDGGKFEWMCTSGGSKTGALCISGYGTRWRLNVQESGDDRLMFVNTHRSRVPSVKYVTDNLVREVREQSCIVYTRMK